MLQCFQPFHGLVTQWPGAMDKVKAISGNVAKENLDMSPTDSETLFSDVSVVIYPAASVRFDDPIEKAFRTNV